MTLMNLEDLYCAVMDSGADAIEPPPYVLVNDSTNPVVTFDAALCAVRIDAPPAEHIAERIERLDTQAAAVDSAIDDYEDSNRDRAPGLDAVLVEVRSLLEAARALSDAIEN